MLLRQTGFQIALFLGSLVFFSWPFWSAPESRGIWFAYFYFFGVWALLVLFLLIYRPRTVEPDSNERSGGEIPEDYV